MKRTIILLALVFPFLFVNGQKIVFGVSQSAYVNITKDPPKPPYLEISSLRFSDTDGNRKIDANEQSVIYFELHNSGLGPGLNLKVTVEEVNRIQYLEFDKSIDIGSLEVGETSQISVPIKAGMGLPAGKTSFNIKIDEANGFDSNPVEIEIETMAFRAPMVKVVDYKITSESKRVQKRRPFNLQVLIQNVGEGTADDVSIKMPIPEGVYCLSANETQIIGMLEAGKQYLIDYTLVTNTEYNSETIPLDIQVSEKYGRYAADEMLTLTLNQYVSSEKLVVEGKKEQKATFAIGSLTSKVDKNIPYNNNKNPYRIALVIGNEDYSRTLNAEANVEFARNDAEVFRQYALNVLGVEEKNMHFLLDATAGQMQRKIDLVKAIIERLGDKGELIFYYAGHGCPDENTKTPYIIPVDVDGTNLSSAIKLSEVYRKFGSTDAARVTVFLDACFSGGGRNQALLAARNVKIKPNTEEITGNMVVFSATTGKQSALPYKSEKHGMFTYFLLEKIQQTNGAIEYGELYDYLRDKVGIESLRENGKPQDPEMNVSYEVADDWRKWEIK